MKNTFATAAPIPSMTTPCSIPRPALISTASLLAASRRLTSIQEIFRKHDTRYALGKLLCIEQETKRQSCQHGGSPRCASEQQVMANDEAGCMALTLQSMPLLKSQTAAHSQIPEQPVAQQQGKGQLRAREEQSEAFYLLDDTVSISLPFVCSCGNGTGSSIPLLPVSLAALFQGRRSCCAPRMAVAVNQQDQEDPRVTNKESPAGKGQCARAPFACSDALLRWRRGLPTGGPALLLLGGLPTSGSTTHIGSFLRYVAEAGRTVAEGRQDSAKQDANVCVSR